MVRFRDLKLRAKQMVGLGLMLAVFVGMSLFALGEMDRLRDEIEAINVRSIPSMLALSAINLDVSTLRIHQLQYELVSDPAERRELSGRMATLMDSINTHRDAYEELAAATPALEPFDLEREQHYDAFDRHWDDYQGLFIELLYGGEDEQAAVALLTSAGPTYDALSKSLEALLDVNQRRTAFAATRARQNSIRSRRVILGTLFVTIGVFFFLSVVLMRFITRPIRQLEEAAQSIARGRLDVQLEVRSNDEIGSLARSFNHMTHSLAGAQQQLIIQEKLASLGQLTAGIAHEIKNPLNFVNNFAQLSDGLVKELGEIVDRHAEALPEASRAEAREVMADLQLNVRKIAEHGRRADGIVRSMLLHSRGSKGVRQPVDLNTFVDENTQLAYHGIRASRPDFSATIHKTLDPEVGSVEVVAQDLGRVLLNLLNNAFYAVGQRRLDPTFAGVPEVHITTRRDEGGVTIVVSDNGGGIPQSLQKRVFEPFFTTKPAGEGTGLGLSLSYEIITRGHGGRLSMESREGEGTTFTIWLPAPRMS